MKSKSIKRITVLGLTLCMLVQLAACTVQSGEAVITPLPSQNEQQDEPQNTSFPETTAEHMPEQKTSPTVTPTPASVPTVTATTAPVGTEGSDVQVTPTPTPTPVDFIDTEPPVMVTRPIYITEGDPITYSAGVTVTDNSGEKVKAVVLNKSDVNKYVPGEYTVNYSATDSAGNVSYASTTIYVRNLNDITEEEALDAAYAALDEIITEDMTELEKIHAIYLRCCRITYSDAHISYNEEGFQYEWQGAAYLGLNMNQGDCYTFAVTAWLLLTCAGIDNLLVNSEPYNLKIIHFWNMINLGDGWLYFDTTKFSGFDKRIFLYTQEMIEDWDEQKRIYDEMKNNAKRPPVHGFDWEKFQITPIQHLDEPILFIEEDGRVAGGIDKIYTEEDLY